MSRKHVGPGLLDFNEAEHVYRLDGEVAPSVTEIIRGGAGLPTFARDAATRGQDVHTACELLDNDRLDEALFGAAYPELIPYVNGWKKFKVAHDVEILENELMLSWRGDPTLKDEPSVPAVFCGTLDRILRFDLFGRRVGLFDIKTSASPTVQGRQRAIGRADLQTAAYQLAYDAAFPGVIETRGVVQLTPDGNYQLLEFDNFAADAWEFLGKLREYLRLQQKRKAA